MLRSWNKMLLVAGLIVLAVVVILAAQVDNWGRDFSTNHAATSADASDPSLRSLELPASPADVLAGLLEFVEQTTAWTRKESSLGQDNPRTSIDKEEDRSRQAFTVPLVHTSRLFGFSDDVQVFLQPAPSGTLVDVASQSRIGRGDLGQNPKNIRELLRALQSQFAVADLN